MGYLLSPVSFLPKRLAPTNHLVNPLCHFLTFYFNTKNTLIPDSAVLLILALRLLSGDRHLQLFLLPSSLFILHKVLL